MRLIHCVPIGAALVVNGLVACSSTPDFTAFPEHFEKARVVQEPDISLTPGWVVKQGKEAREKVVSWPGFLERMEPQPDKEGHTIFVMRHRYLSLSPPSQDGKKPVRFYVSEASGSEFQCRVLFKKVPTATDIQDFIKRNRALTCTGRVLGFTPKGAPVLQAMQLEAFPVQGYSQFQPVLDKQGRMELDEYGRPRYQNL